MHPTSSSRRRGRTTATWASPPPSSRRSPAKDAPAASGTRRRWTMRLLPQSRSTPRRSRCRPGAIWTTPRPTGANGCSTPAAATVATHRPCAPVPSGEARGLQPGHSPLYRPAAARYGAGTGRWSPRFPGLGQRMAHATTLGYWARECGERSHELDARRACALPARGSALAWGRGKAGARSSAAPVRPGSSGAGRVPVVALIVRRGDWLLAIGCSLEAVGDRTGP